MPDAHPAHSGLPSLYLAEVGVFRDRWTMSVIRPEQGVAAGPNLDLGPVKTFTEAHPDDPGRYLIAMTGRVPVLPRDEAVRMLAEHGFVVAGAARDEARTDCGWTQVAGSEWTAPCQPVAAP
ncbi:hypothetical protein [Streptomyces sp. NPDC059743]|uniref:hypothetical protein n=1 Tax=Streptomyces sp. NPDC059743 TaxID=3346928 RepID=UPI003648B7BE